jgi:hypothetical protein
MKIINASIVSAFDAKTVGTKVTHKNFNAHLADAVGSFKFPTETVEEDGIVEGQGFIPIHDAALASVSAGVGKRTENEDDFVLRFYRGRVRPFLKRELAAKATGLAAIVYTRAAYLVDADVDADELARVEASKATHVLVAILAFAGPQSPVGPDAFVHNLAGGNANVQGLTGSAIREQAKEIDDYHSEWASVAD